MNDCIQDGNLREYYEKLATASKFLINSSLTYFYTIKEFVYNKYH